MTEQARPEPERASGAPGAPCRSWKLVFAGMPPGPNARLHWRHRAAITRAWREQAGVLVRRAGIPPLARIRLSAIFYRRRLGVADPDNDLARCKVLADSLVAMGVVPTDTYRYVEWAPPQERRGAPGVELVIEEVAGC